MDSRDVDSLLEANLALQKVVVPDLAKVELHKVVVLGLTKLSVKVVRIGPVNSP